MNEKIHAIKKNNTWKLVSLSNSNKVMNVKCVYKTKYKQNGEVIHFKARFRAKDHMQIKTKYWLFLFLYKMIRNFFK